MLTGKMREPAPLLHLKKKTLQDHYAQIKQGQEEQFAQRDKTINLEEKKPKQLTDLSFVYNLQSALLTSTPDELKNVSYREKSELLRLAQIINEKLKD